MKSKLDLLLVLDEKLLGNSQDEDMDLAELFHKLVTEEKKES